MTSRHVGPLIGLVAAVLALVPAAPAAAADVPYDDPNAIGSMTLCNRDLEPITSGSLTDRPFVWRAVGDTAAPAPYDGKGRRAVLYYVQPRQNVDPAEWTSEILTAASTYSDPSAPIAQATPIDFPLIAAATNLPPQWGDFAQLRMYFTSDGVPQSQEYLAADIKISGDTWTLVRGGDASCDAGRAVSPELALADYEKRLRQVQNGTDDLSKEFGLTPESDEDTSGGQSTDDGDSSSDEPSAAAAAAGNDATPTATEESSPLLWIALLVAVAVLGGVGAYVAIVNRRASAGSA